MAKLYFTSDERQLMMRVIEKGLLQSYGRDSPQWWVTRIALAKSLAMDGLPDGDEFMPPPHTKEGSELHWEQITGKDKGGIEDYTRPLQLLLSVRHGKDYFAGNDEFVEILHRHIRRGLSEIRSSWRENFDFHDYLYQEMFFEPATAAEPGAMDSVDQDALNRAFRQISVQAEIFDQKSGPRLTLYTLQLKGVDDYDRLRRGLDEMAFILGLGSNALTMELGTGERRVVLSVPRPMASWTFTRWDNVRASLEGHGFALPVCPGTGVQGEPFVFDLGEAPHLFVAGTTGSGKSVCLHAIILSLIEGPSPPELVLIDPKAVEFSPYEDAAFLRPGHVITDMSEAGTELRELVEEMNRRQRDFAALGAKNIDEAQEKGSFERRVVVVVDELADLLHEDSDSVTPLVRMAQKARSFGIHLVLATQRPEAATFPGLLRSNVPSRIALTVQKNAESRIILDEGGAENLLMRGDMLIRIAGQKTVRAHGVNITRSDIPAALARIGEA